MLEIPFLSFSKSWLQTMRDYAPVIGAAVIIIIVVAIVLFSWWWYRYWMKKGLKEIEKQRSEGRL